MKPAVFLAAMALWAVFALPVAAVSSSEALAALGTCLAQNNPNLQPFGQTFQLGDVPYYVFYYPLASPHRMVAVVGQEDGQLIRDSGVLEPVTGGIYDSLILSDIRAKGFSAETLQAAIQSNLGALDDQQAKMQVFQTQTTEKYPQLSFQELLTRLDALRSKADLLNLQLSDTISEEQQYTAAPSAEGAANAIRQYNASFTALFGYFTAYDDYNKAIGGVERQLYEKSIPDPDNRNINTNLEHLRDIGISSLYAKAKKVDPRKGPAGLGLQADPQWVNDSISSFQFQNLACQANDAYNQALGQYTSIARSESVLSAAGLATDVNNIKADWKLIQRAHDKASLEGHQYVLDNVPVVKAEMDKLTARYEALNAPAPTAKPQAQSDPTNGLILAILLAIGGYGFYMYRKKQQEAADESGLDEHH